MASPDRERLRETFDEAAELYDRAAAYPPALFADLADLAELESRPRVLEIGSGPGRRRGRWRSAATRSSRSSLARVWLRWRANSLASRP